LKDAVGADDPGDPFPVPGPSLLQLPGFRFSETGSVKMNEFDPLRTAALTMSMGLLDRRGNQGAKINGSGGHR